jgi:hypothetical protein
MFYKVIETSRTAKRFVHKYECYVKPNTKLAGWRWLSNF